jgi:NADH:ubiquinone reductase (H+-translocating)
VTLLFALDSYERVARAERAGVVTVNRYLEAADWPGVFTLGDCAAIPDARTGTPYAPTAQNAIRQAEVAARNIAATLSVGTKRPLEYDPIGALAVLGMWNAVAELKRRRFSGFPAFWMWRTVYWAKLPSAERRIRVAIDRTLDLFFRPSTVQFGSGRMPMGEPDHRRPEHESCGRDSVPPHDAASATVSAHRMEG